MEKQESHERDKMNVMKSETRERNLRFSIFILAFLFGSVLIILAGSAAAELDPNPYWISDRDDKSRSVAWGDFDKDGDPDLAVGNNGPNHIYENVDGNLTTEPVWMSEDDADTALTHKVMWGDIDGDDWLDLVAVNGAWGSGYDVVYLNNEGNLSTTADWRNENSDFSAGMDLGDYDGDGDLDLVTSNYNGRECVYENVGGTLTTSPTWQSYLYDDGTFDAAWFDVDNDGDLDLHFGCSGTMDSKDSNANRVYFNNPDLWGSQRFGQFPDWRSNDEMWTNTVQAGDIDNDGDMDIITSNCFNNYNTVAMYENTGNSLDPDYTWSIEVYWPFGCALGDVNLDGWLDIGVSSYYSVATLVMNNNGTLDDIRVWNSSDSVQSYRCDFGDMNGDGYPEFAVANHNSSDGRWNNTVYLNNISRPWVTIDSPSDRDEVSGTVLIEGDANYSKGPVDKVEMSFDDGETWHTANETTNWTFEWDATGVDNGNCTITARAKAGMLYSDPAKVNVTVKNENHRPEIEITDPEEKDVLGGIHRIRGTTSDEDGNDQIRQLEVRIDEGDWQKAEDTTHWSYDWDTTEVEDGEHTIHARAFDGRDYSYPAVVNVAVNNEEPANHMPTISITEPESGSTVEGIVTIEGTAEDEDNDEQIEKVEMKIDDGNWVEAEGTLDWSFEWDTTEVDDGEHSIYARAYDGKDYSDLTEVTVNVNNEEPEENNNPEIEITSVEKTDDYTLNIEWTTSDQDGDPLKIDLYYDTDINPENGKNLLAKGLDNTTGRFDWDISGMENGNYYILAVARDSEGAEGSDYSEKISITLPERTPDFAIVSLEILPPTPGSDDTVLIRIIVKNEGAASGTGTVEFLVGGVQLENKSLTLQPDREKTLTAFWSAVEGNHTITIQVTVEGDSEQGNNEMERVVRVTGTPGGKEKESDDDFPMVHVGLALAVVGVVVAMVGGVAVYWRKEGTTGEVVGTVVASGEGQGSVVKCPGCGGETQYSEEEDDHYCWECEEYVGEMIEEGRM